MEICPTVPTADEVPVYQPQAKYWSSSASYEKPIYYSKTGLSSKESWEATTLCTAFEEAAKNKADKPGLRVERPVADLASLPKKDGKPQVPPALPLNEWKTWTWSEFYADSKKFAKGCIAAGVKEHDGVNIFGFNSPEWNISMMGSILSGGKAAGIYPTDTGDQIRYKCDHANGAVISVDGQKTFDKVKEQVPKLPYLKAIVAWGEISSTADLKNGAGKAVKIYKWEDFFKLGESVSDEDLKKRMDAQRPGHSCVMVYTSGTTGNPKAVLLSHDSLLYVAFALQTSRIMEDYGNHPEEERVVSYLPTSHVAGMFVDVICPLFVTGYRKAWGTVHFARPYDLKAGTIVERMVAVKPTLFLGVPRIWEKMAEKLKSALSEATGFKAKLAKWALHQGFSWSESTNFNHKHPRYHHIPHKGFFYHVADKLVLHKVRAKLGLDQCKFCLTGAAPIHLDTQNFLAQFGLVINEAYGMSESAAACVFSSTMHHLFGVCGPAFPGTEVKLFQVDLEDINKKKEVAPAKDIFHNLTEEEQGEICLRGRCVMNGYLANPRFGAAHVKEIDEKNAACIDKEGFLHTGDKGTVSKYGFYKITGRYKELIITAGGENVAPVPIEDAVKTVCPIISNFVMIGDKRKFNVALVTLKLQGATGELPGTEQLELSDFKYLGTQSKTIEEAMKDEKIIKEITEKIKETNNNGNVVVSNAAKIQKFMILPRDLSIVNEDFTPTLKLKRGFVTDRFSPVIDLMYASKEIYVPFPLDKLDTYFKNK